MLNELGCSNKMLGQEAACSEPALEETGVDILGGVHTPDDESGDAHAFTRNLALSVQVGEGITLRYNETVSHLEHEAGRITSVVTDKGIREADAYVASIASYTPITPSTWAKAPNLSGQRLFRDHPDWGTQ